MPFGDRTGPFGAGPRTGRGAGFCGGFGVPGSLNAGLGSRFWGRGRGGGRGWRNWFPASGLTGWQRAAGWLGWFLPEGVPPEYAGPGREQELNALKNQASHFENTLQDIRKRIDHLEAKDK
jgi:Family of unknown function (DUF5320)